MTDPIWSEQASPLTSIGPRRRRMPGVRFEDLPRIDIVLLSHNHYDHLDLATLRRLADRGQSQFIVPRGVARQLQSQSIGHYPRTGLGQMNHFRRNHNPQRPGVAFFGAGLFDPQSDVMVRLRDPKQRTTSSISPETPRSANISPPSADALEPRALALLPIGAYEPRWFMSSVHMGPEEAVKAHQILGARTSIAIHHGTFQLTDEGIDTPKNRLIECAPGDSFLTLNNGQSVTLGR